MREMGQCALFGGTEGNASIARLALTFCRAQRHILVLNSVDSTRKMQS